MSAGRPRKNAVASVRSRSAPVGGLNTRDAIADMAEQDAVVLTNWFPRESRIEVRNGYELKYSGLTTPVETLMEYASPTTNQLFAAIGTAFYDVSASGTYGAPVQSGLTNARWQHVMFGTAGGSFLVAVNGADAPRNYNGTVWATTPAITGAGLSSSSNFIHINAYKQRLFFTEKDTLKFWYLPVSSIGGTVLDFDLAALCRKGGYLVGMATWTVDGGRGSDDLAVFITSEGEVLIYNGTNPASAADWSLIGVYSIPRPIGRRCFVEYSGDLLIITENGVYPLSKALINGVNDRTIRLSSKIDPSLVKDAFESKTVFGWDLQIFGQGEMGIVNVPTMTEGVFKQYVFNLTTYAWCLFNGIPSVCWALFNGRCYFGGSDGKTYVFGEVNSDNNEPISADVLPAFTYFGTTARKRFTMTRPVFSSTTGVEPGFRLVTDFDQITATEAPTVTASGGSAWDVSPWDTSPWADSLQLRINWRTVAGLGFSGSLRLKSRTRNQQLQLLSIDYLFESASGNVL